MSGTFTGFSPESFAFLRALPENNNKAWFEQHKPDYQQHILKPLQELVTHLTPLMLSIDEELEVTPALSKTISRIYRDTRFSKDKSPYKTCHWITFKRISKEWHDYPAYYFEISPYSYRYGMGFYEASRETMDKFRAKLDRAPDSFLESVAFFNGQHTLAIAGDEYKRPLRGDLPDNLKAWYNRKNLYLISHNENQGDTLGTELVKRLQSEFSAMAPLYDFFLSCTR